ncbi:MAG: FAD-dependent oxidoreductase [Alphaproteobacteria bacterium]
MAIHVVGAGLAGLSAAVELARAPAGHEIIVHEAAPRAAERKAAAWSRGPSRGRAAGRMMSRARMRR